MMKAYKVKFSMRFSDTRRKSQFYYQPDTNEEDDFDFQRDEALNKWKHLITTDEHIHENKVQDPAIVDHAIHYKPNSPGETNVDFYSPPEITYGFRVRTRREYSCDQDDTMKEECERLIKANPPAVVNCGTTDRFRSVNVLMYKF